MCLHSSSNITEYRTSNLVRQLILEQDNLTERFREEIKRLGLSFSKVGKVCGVSKNSAISWGQGSKIPAEALAKLMREEGMDVFYVLVGREMSAPQPVMLSPAEVELIDEYRNLPEDQQAAVRQMTSAWSLQAVQKGTSQLIRKPKKRN